jgi:hypothetical protein
MTAKLTDCELWRRQMVKSSARGYTKAEYLADVLYLTEYMIQARRRGCGKWPGLTFEDLCRRRWWVLAEIANPDSEDHE